MHDFFQICTKENLKRKEIDSITVYPKFIVGVSKDLMIRGGDFYAVWDEERGLWSTDEQTIKEIVDKEIDNAIVEVKKKYGDDIKINPLYMWDSDSGVIDKWHKYVQRQLRDRFTQLDTKIIFDNTDVTREDYASKKLPYAMKRGDITAYDELMSVLYSDEERAKLEWAIGSIIAGDSKHIQKFIVLYGSAGTGKSTVLNIIQGLFEGYYTTFNAKSLASSNNEFALEDFKTNPLIAIQHDGDLSRIADNTKLNSIVSHEYMVVNEKFKSKYTAKFDSFIFMGTNKPVYITEAKSGLLRRLIDVRPTGNKISYTKYNKLLKQISYEYGAIAAYCLKVYQKMGENYYNAYIPKDMMSVTNDFYDFIEEHYTEFSTSEYMSLSNAWNEYKKYCELANVQYPMPRKTFKEELKNYYTDFYDRTRVESGENLRNVYSGFKTEMFDTKKNVQEKDNEEDDWLKLKKQSSIFDSYCSNCPAQYASKNETPMKKWDYVTETLSDIDTSLLHYVMPQEQHIVIDFDLKDEEGNKQFSRNKKAAESWPPTYAEVSKGGEGIHLHYIYDGDVSKLCNRYSDDVEVKTFMGKASLRRKLTKCNNLPIAHISSSLPIKEEKVVNYDVIKTEKQLRGRIEKCLRKEHHGATAPEVDFIFKHLEEAYNSGLSYDVSDMKQRVMSFAIGSTHQADKCVKTVSKMHFKSEDKEEEIVEGKYKSDKIVFFDIEVFPNFFGVAWKFEDDKFVTKLFNPSADEISELVQYKLVGFNNRRYDNHILYARLQGYSIEELYSLSRRIIEKKDKNAFFREAYNLSYTDIYDFAATKQGLKKWEIELGIHHKELGLPWEKPVPEESWPLIMDYCENDVIATEAVFKHLSADFEAREILCAITDSSLNTTTNQNTIKMIVGNDKEPQTKFVYTDLSKMFPGYKYTINQTTKKPVSIYRNEEVGEGGYVYSEPGMYKNVALLDIASMHPTSAINLDIFGPYTKNFEELVKARLYIKHGDYDEASKLFDGKLQPYLKDKSQSDALAYALKIAINSVYGLTAATFDNKLRDPRNVDNIVAKRGALFMIDLKHAVQEKGYVVAHIKTDSIKIPDADRAIIEFVQEFGKKYGYTFEHEATYDRLCLVNDAVYIAKEKDGKWTATGTQFKVPYVFKTLFSKEPIEFKDLCETKSVTTSLYLDMNENLDEDTHDYQFVGGCGAFCPIKAGCGGGLLVREKDGKYYAATGTKGYRWLEAEVVQRQKKEKDIDESYYQHLVDEAIKEISKYGDVEQFVNG